MREVSTQTRMMVDEGGFDSTYVADLMYNGDRRLAGLTMAGTSLKWDASQFVAGSGQSRIIWADDFATSMIPRQLGDWFSPFGAELQIDCMIGAGVFVERVPMGRFVIEEVPDAIERSLLFDGRLIHPGESFGVTLKDALIRVHRDELPFPMPAKSTSVWGEVQSLTGMPIVRSLPDGTVPAAIAYEGAKSTIVSQLFDVIGGWPYADPRGVLTAKPKAWGPPVDEVRGVVSAPRMMRSDQTCNRVVVEGKSPAGEPVYGVAEVTSGFLRVRNADGSASPFGVQTYRYASSFLETAAQCSKYAAALLPRVSRLRGVTRSIVEPFNPLRELGDVLKFDGQIVRVIQVTHNRPTTALVVEVQDA